MNEPDLPELREKVLADVQRAREFLSAAEDLEEVNDLRTEAGLMAHAARTQRLGRAAELGAAEIRVRAERRIGQLAPAGRHGGNRKTGLASSAQGNLDASRAVLHRWRQLAHLPDALFETLLARARKADRSPSTTDLASIGKRVHAGLLDPETGETKPRPPSAPGLIPEEGPDEDDEYADLPWGSGPAPVPEPDWPGFVAPDPADELRHALEHLEDALVELGSFKNGEHAIADEVRRLVEQALRVARSPGAPAEA